MRFIRKLVFILIKLIPKKRNRYIFGSWGGKKFSDNSKYLFLYYFHNTDYDIYWVTKSKDIYVNLKKLGYPCVMSNTYKSFVLHSTASKYFWTSFADVDVDEKWLGGAESINLFHGVGPKKVGLSDEINSNVDKNYLIRISKKIKWIRNSVKLFTTSEQFRGIYSRSFNLDSEVVFALNGQPRTDVFFDSSLEFEGDKFPFDRDKRVILYMPTHRQEGRKFFDLEAWLPLNRIEEYCRENDSLFVINRHFYHMHEDTNLDKYKFIVDVTSDNLDTQLLLKYADVLITDYSSCYVDYLLLERPIIYYCFDFEDYKTFDRTFNFPFDTITPGHKVYNQSELIEVLDIVTDKNYSINSDKYRYTVETFFGSTPEKEVSKKIVELLEGDVKKI